ncbi:TM2 domain-containing protein 3-like [Rhopilema esculentum]|uniref:TM2 domain-containing protein 3-like n=1 Tax=Rhopilema esculentum TaxID=499914 RepID=UPI0031E1702C
MAGLSQLHFKGLLVFILCPYIVRPTTTPLGSTQSTLGTTVSSQICENDASANCYSLPQSCANCTFNSSCVYGDETTINCTAMLSVDCKGERSYAKNVTCQYCYQLPKEMYVCHATKTCKVPTSPQQRMVVYCTVKDNVYCMGNRRFRKSVPCNWSSGYRWSTAMLLSLSLGGFGVDRFYLGHWKAGLGKVFSFGGLGVWTLVDIVLIAIGYVGPADGSLYIF